MKRCPLCSTTYDDQFKVCPQDGATLHSGQTTAVGHTEPMGLGSDGADTMIGRTIAGRFRIERKLGEGGMGAVYKAEHVKMGRPCAIKILNATALNDPEALPRFTREAQMSSRIEHQHAVTIYDYGESEDGIVYLAMEYIEGETLTKVLEREGKFSLDRIVRIARQIGDALDAAHALGIVHRDLKPDNIMLARKGAGGDFVKVLDFGIAKMAGNEDRRHDLTQAGLIIGTPYYMSPEQVAGEKLDPRSDIFSFALIVYEMISGRLPYSGQNTQAIMVSRLTTSPVLLRTVNPDVPSGIETAVMRALARDRDLRTDSAGTFVRELEGGLTGGPPAAVELGQTQVATRPQGRPETMPVNQAFPNTPPPGMPITPQFGQPPVQPGFGGADGATVAVTASGQQPMPQTDRAPYVPQSFPQPPSGGGYSPMAGAQPAKKGGGAGLVIGALVVLLLLGGVAGLVGLGYYKGWFGGGGSTAGGNDPPINGGGPPKTPPTTGGDGPVSADVAAEAEKLFMEGYNLQSKKDDAGAVAKYKEAIAKQPVFPKAYRNLGAAYVGLGKYDEAIRALETANQQYTTKDYQVVFNMGLAYLGTAQYPKSADAFAEAGKLKDGYDVHLYRGIALAYSGDDSAAKAEYKACLAMNPPQQEADIAKQLLAGAPLPPVDALLGS